MQWNEAGICPTGFQADRFWHAGLSSDGKLCFVAGVDVEVYFVWDIDRNTVIWTDERESSPSLDQWIQKGALTIEDDPARGRYRIFGLHHNFAITHHKTTGSSLTVDLPNEKVRVADGAAVQDLKFDAFSGDWAFASFSEDGGTVAILEPYSVTFCRRS